METLQQTVLSENEVPTWEFSYHLETWGPTHKQDIPKHASWRDQCEGTWSCTKFLLDSTWYQNQECGCEDRQHVPKPEATGHGHSWMAIVMQHESSKSWQS